MRINRLRVSFFDRSMMKCESNNHEESPSFNNSPYIPYTNVYSSNQSYLTFQTLKLASWNAPVSVSVFRPALVWLVSISAPFRDLFSLIPIQCSSNHLSQIKGILWGIIRVGIRIRTKVRTWHHHHRRRWAHHTMAVRSLTLHWDSNKQSRDRKRIELNWTGPKHSSLQLSLSQSHLYQLQTIRPFRWWLFFYSK